MINTIDWGLVEYREAWDRQKQLAAIATERRGTNTLVLCEHPAVITVGRSGSGSNIVAPEAMLRANGVDTVFNDRGGDVTLHNPGQLVGYPIFDLASMRTDLHWFLREIEECIIETIAEYGIRGGRVDGLTGVWVESSRKICAMGLHCSRWITSHGFALNANNNLDEFGFIVPCGIADKGVTSIEKETGRKIDMAELKRIVQVKFQNRFGGFDCAS